jgi:hypothetical protein
MHWITAAGPHRHTGSTQRFHVERLRRRIHSMLPRRHLLAALACCAPLAGHPGAPADRPRHKVSAATLHRALSERFPIRLALGPVFELQLTAPGLLLLPSRNRLGAALVAHASGPGLAPVAPGEVDVAFALRYERHDRSLRAHGLEVLDVRWPDMPAELAGILRRMLPKVAEDALGEVVLYRFAPRDLALADTMGFEPQRFTVLDDGLLVVFGPKPTR